VRIQSRLRLWPAMRPTARTRSWLAHCSGKRGGEPQRARRHEAPSEPRPTASKRRPVRQPRFGGTRARRDDGHSVARHADSERPSRVGTVRAEPSIPRTGRPAAAQVHRRNPQMPRARAWPTGPGPGPARYRSDHSESRPGTSPAGPEPGPAGRPGRPRVGFRGSAAEAAAEGLKKEDHESPALRRGCQQHERK
jgi:hypothetical protein